MSNTLIGIIAILFVYLIEIVVCFVAIRLVNKVTNKTKLDCRNTYISSIRTLHVVALIGVIYFVPLVALVICLAFNSLLIPVSFQISQLSTVPKSSSPRSALCCAPGTSSRIQRIFVAEK